MNMPYEVYSVELVRVLWSMRNIVLITAPINDKALNICFESVILIVIAYQECHPPAELGDVEVALLCRSFSLLAARTISKTKVASMDNMIPATDTIIMCFDDMSIVILEVLERPVTILYYVTVA